MSGDPNHGFGQYSAAAATTQWNWAQMLANSTASSPVASIQAAVAAQRASFHPHHHHPNPNVLYSQAGPNAAMPPSPWTQHWGGSWPHQNGQSNRVPSSFSVQSHAAIAGLQQQPQQQHQHPGPSAQSTQNAFKYRSNATSNSGSSSSSGSTPLLSAKTGSLEAPSTANSPAHSSSSNNNNSNSGGETKKDESEDVWGYLEAQASFLGPSLWDNGDLKMEYMDLDEFLSENGIPIGEGLGRSSSNKGVTPPRSQASSDGSSGSGLTRSALLNSNDSCDGVKPGSSSSSSGCYLNSPPARYKSDDGNRDESDDSNDDESNDSSALESIAPVVLETTPPVTRRKRVAVSVSSSFNDNSSDDGSYVPGQDFDPKSRQFSPEELRPQPMSKKSKKQYVPDDMKDDKYWARRRKNNMAAKRSRDARRVKENQIAMRAAFLEKENAVLKAELEKVTKLYTAALKRLEQYEKPGKKC